MVQSFSLDESFKKHLVNICFSKADDELEIVE